MTKGQEMTIDTAKAYIRAVQQGDQAALGQLHLDIVWHQPGCNRFSGAIAADLGFQDASNFVKFFKRETGTTPLQFREGYERA